MHMEEEVDFLLSDLDIRHCIDVMHVEKMYVIVSLGRSLTFKERRKMV